MALGQVTACYTNVLRMLMFVLSHIGHTSFLRGSNPCKDTSDGFVYIKLLNLEIRTFLCLKIRFLLRFCKPLVETWQELNSLQNMRISGADGETRYMSAERDHIRQARPHNEHAWLHSALVYRVPLCPPIHLFCRLGHGHGLGVGHGATRSVRTALILNRLTSSQSTYLSNNNQACIFPHVDALRD